MPVQSKVFTPPDTIKHLASTFEIEINNQRGFSIYKILSPEELVITKARDTKDNNRIIGNKLFLIDLESMDQVEQMVRSNWECSRQLIENYPEFQCSCKYQKRRTTHTKFSYIVHTK